MYGHEEDDFDHMTHIRLLWREQLAALPRSLRYAVRRLLRLESRYYLTINGMVVARFVARQDHLALLDWTSAAHKKTIDRAFALSKQDNLDNDTLAELLSLAHQVITGTAQGTLRSDAAYYPHLIEARDKYMKARIDALAPVQPLTSSDIVTMYSYGAEMQPWNHQIPMNCPTYWDGCNCEGGPYYQMPGETGKTGNT